MTRPRVIVVGGGPAGLMAAETLATTGVAVDVHDRMPSAGRKLLMAGRGGLNLTHSEPPDRFFARYGGARSWLEPALMAFPPEQLIAWAESLGQPTFTGSSGRVFPRAMKASPLLRAWLRCLDTLGVRIITGSTWTGIDPATGHPMFETAPGVTRVVPADAVVLALGGASWPRLGSNGAWVATLRALGVEIADLKPANMAVVIDWNPHMARVLGEPLKRIAIAVIADGTPRTSQRGEAVITATGLEGGAIYAVAAELRDALERSGRAALHIDLRPDLSVDELAARLAKAPAKSSVSTRLHKAGGLSPAAVALLRESSPGAPPPRDPLALARAIKTVVLQVRGTAGLDRAISSAGGITHAAVDERLMLRALPGVFAAGEMLDWEAPTGGYLLQATFATAVLAAGGAAEWLAAGGRLAVAKCSRP